MKETVSFLHRDNAGEAELARIMELLELMHAEVGKASLNRTKVKGVIGECLDSGMICVALDGGAIVGVLGLALSSPWYSDDPCLKEAFTFVHPAFRRSRHAKNLLEIAIAGARQLSEQAGREIPLYAAVFSDQRTEGKCRLYRRHLKPMGELFYSAGEAA